MKKFKVLFLTLFISIFALFAVCFLGGCDFVQYVDNRQEQTLSDEFKQLQEDYVNKLYSITSAIKFREKEQKLYEYAVLDAVNELYECSTEEELKQVYEKHLVIIGNIKTDKEYADEEEANAISVYRVAILNQADSSFDKQKYHDSQIVYLEEVFVVFSAKLFDTDDMEEMNALLQNFYFDIYKENEILGLYDYADISVYEESQKQKLLATLNECIDDIRSCATDETFKDIKDIYKFEVYKRNTIKKLKSYLDLQSYRDEQVEEITTILQEYLELAENLTLPEEDDELSKYDLAVISADNVFGEYQIAVYDIPTADDLYADELAILKEEFSNSLLNTYKLSLYRENEGLVVQELLQSFKGSLETIKTKEDVLTQYILVKSRLDAVKTSAILDAEDRANLIEKLYEQLIESIYKYVDLEDQNEFLKKADAVHSAMKDRVSQEGIYEEYNSLAIEVSIEGIREELRNYNDTVVYREADLENVNSLKGKYLAKLTDGLKISEAKAILQEAKNEIDKVKTNDDRWNDSVEEFRAKLNSLYGNAILEEPRSLTEANDYCELADIIDYYAFYQLSGTEFVCDTFRVKLNFDHNDAWTELVNVYWYCELIRTAVGITNYFENNSDYLVFQLIPYDFASVSNERPTLNRLKSAVEFDSDKSQMTVRTDDFDDFAYYKYKRTIQVWNSQQLWYALEHEYVPICAPNSPAELVLNRAKEILREIIMEGMSDEEKVFHIYTWFGNNCQYYWYYGNYFDTVDMVRFPDENISRLRSLYIDGVLLDNLGICYGYAKANCLLLRMEGIEAYYVFSRNSINDIGYVEPGGVGHAYNYIKINNNWYLGDALRSFYQTPNHNGISYLFLMLPASKYANLFFNQQTRVEETILQEIENNAFESWDVYNKLLIGNNSIVVDDNNISSLIDVCKNNLFDSFSVFCEKNMVDKIMSILSQSLNNDLFKISYNDSLVEIFIY